MKTDHSTVRRQPEHEQGDASSLTSSPTMLQQYLLFAKAHKENFFSWGWATLIACFIAGRGFPAPLPTILSLAAVLAITSSVYIYNDVTDADADKLNPKKCRRPLPSGYIPKEDAMRLAYLTGAVGVILSLFLNRFSFVLCMAYLFLFAIYSHPSVHLKKRFIVKELTVASGYILTSLIAGFAVAGTFQPTVVYAGLFYFFFSFMGMPAFHDITDVKEDEIYGIRTMAIVFSWKTKVQMLMIFILAVMTLTPFTYVQFGFNAALPIVVVAMGLVVLRYLVPLSAAFEQTLFLKTRKISYVYYILIHIAFVVATLKL
jgi:4-hydroxybenzoate polyprenyltransferase